MKGAMMLSAEEFHAHRLVIIFVMSVGRLCSADFARQALDKAAPQSGSKALPSPNSLGVCCLPPRLTRRLVALRFMGWWS